MLHFIVALIATSALAQAPPPNNLFWTQRVKVKLDKKLEWEKKLVTFAKAHYPTTKYRVWEIITGPHSGSYFIAIGPTSYKDLDTPPSFPKGEALMKTDGQGLDALCEAIETNYWRRVESLSMTKQDRKLKYAHITETEIELGTWGDYQAQFVKNKDVWMKNEAAKVDYDIYRPSNSGAGNRFVVASYFEKLEELDVNLNFPELYDKAYGNNEYYKAINTYYDKVSNSKTELRVLRSDLSSL